MDQNIENVVNYEGRDEAYKKSKYYRQELLNANFRDTKSQRRRRISPDLSELRLNWLTADQGRLTFSTWS